jgi:hypothetical protein
MKKTYFIFCFLSLCFLGYSQEKKYPEHFGDIFSSNNFWLGENKIKGDAGFAVSKITFLNAQSDLIEFYRIASKTNIAVNLFGDFFIKNTFYFDLISNDQTPFWLGNHFYGLGVYNWRNKKFSYGYENFQPNKFKNAQFDYWTNMKRGLFFISYNYEYKRNFFLLDETSKFVFVPLVRIQPEYVDVNNETMGFIKPILGTNIRYVFFKNIYVETGLFLYPIRKTKLPWDPDFTYGFGIFDWRAFKINFSYGNWIANRYPWQDKEMIHGFMNGEFSLNINYAW